MNLFIFIVEVPLILFKDNANRRQYQICKDKNCKYLTSLPSPLRGMGLFVCLLKRLIDKVLQGFDK